MDTNDKSTETACVGSTPLLGCDYVGSDFGASYLDTCCIGGQLYDMDNCDDDGNLFEPLEFLPCPKCNHKAWVEDKKENLVERGWIDAEDGKARSDLPKFCADFSSEDVAQFSAWWLEGYDERMAEQPNSGDI